MSGEWNPLLESLVEGALEVQGISKTDLCAYLVSVQGQRLFCTSKLRDNGRAERIANEDDGRIFPAWSLFKVFIAVAVSLMIEKLSLLPPDAWDRTFTEVFNHFSESVIIIRPLDGDPTVKDLVFHFKGPCNINHLFLSPEGSPILSATAFLETIPQFTEDAHQKHDTGQLEYSNGNYILLALFIEFVSKQPLAAFLKKHIFDPLGMDRTYMSTEELNSVPADQRVQPNIVSSNSRGGPIPLPDQMPHLADTVELAVMGAYTCLADLGKFFDKVIQGLHDEPDNTLFDRNFTKSLFQGKTKIDKTKDSGYSRFGIFTPLDEDFAGSHSLNRLLSSDGEFSKYTLGKTVDNKRIFAYYMAGCGTGWLHTVYFIPTKRTFIIVLTNTSGPCDASDIVSRLYLQKIFNLRPARTDNRSIKFQPDTVEERTKHHIKLAHVAYQENFHVYWNLEQKNAIQDTRSSDCTDAIGIFENKRSRQSLEVKDLDGVLGVILRGEGKISKPMRFVRKSKTFRICSYPLGTSFLAIDCFGDWETLEFSFEERNGKIFKFTRDGVNMEDEFIRK
ncbi:hypothetical protein B7463_g9547, partial [Scytalidium lignicola]